MFVSAALFEVHLHVFNTSMCNLPLCMQVCEQLPTTTDSSISNLCIIISGSGHCLETKYAIDSPFFVYFFALQPVRMAKLFSYEFFQNITVLWHAYVRVKKQHQQTC